MAIPMLPNEMFVKHKYAVIGVVLALVVISWLCWYFSDKQVIKRQVVGLSWEISKKDSQESTIETALKMRQVQSALADTCTFVIPERNRSESVEKDLAIRYLMYYRERYQMLAVTFEEMDIKFPAKGEAAVRATVLLKRQPPQATMMEVTAPITLMLKKQDGNWLLMRAEIAAALLDD